jgi:hypothetical protein
MMTRLDHARAVPDPPSPWNEIVPALWMGGHFWEDGSGEQYAAVAGDEFELVISLIALDGHGPAEGVEHRVVGLPDAPLSAGQLGQVRELAVVAAAAVRSGRQTLVRCRAGYNRSGLVVAQTLIELGQDSAEAVELIRRRRSSWALHNPAFELYLSTGLDVAERLAALNLPG